MPFARYTGRSSPDADRTPEGVKPVVIESEDTKESTGRLTDSDTKVEPDTKDGLRTMDHYAHQRELSPGQQRDYKSEDSLRQHHPAPETSLADSERIARSAEAASSLGYPNHPHHLMPPRIPAYPVPQHMAMHSAANNCS